MNKLSNKKRSGHIIGCTDWFQIKLSITRALRENGHYSGWLRHTSLFHVITSYFIIPGDYVIFYYSMWLRHTSLFQVITSCFITPDDYVILYYSTWLRHTYTQRAAGNRLHLMGQGLIWHCRNVVKAGHSTITKEALMCENIEILWRQRPCTKCIMTVKEGNRLYKYER